MNRLPGTRLAALLLTIACTAAAPATRPATTRPSGFLAELKADFATLDLDHDGTLTPGEVEKAVVDPAVKDKSAAAVATLRRAMHSKTYKLATVTRESLDRGVPTATTLTDQTPATVPFDGMYASALSRIRGAHRDLFAAETPTLAALHQGRLGDCFCLAPLGAMLARDPQSVVRTFEVGDDDRVTVHFGGNRKVSVGPVTDAELALAASTRDQGVWTNIYELAVGQCRAQARTASAKLLPGDPPTEISAIASGGSAGTVVELLTGHRVRRFSCKPFRDPMLTAERRTERLAELRVLLTGAVLEKRLICGGTPATVKVPGVTPSHAYAILGFDVAKDEVLLWNPHGNTFKPKGDAGFEHGYPTAGGRIRVPLVELVDFFTGFSFETSEPLPAE